MAAVGLASWAAFHKAVIIVMQSKMEAACGSQDAPHDMTVLLATSSEFCLRMCTFSIATHIVVLLQVKPGTSHIEIG